MNETLKLLIFKRRFSRKKDALNFLDLLISANNFNWKLNVKDDTRIEYFSKHSKVAYGLVFQDHLDYYAVALWSFIQTPNSINFRDYIPNCNAEYFNLC